MEYKNNILEAVGNTPLIKINNITKGLKPLILAKLESSNPGGSVKDRIAISMIETAEKNGKIKPGGTIIEATSGNTGIGLAVACSVKGYKLICVLTDKVSAEKINYLKALGADVIVVSNALEHDHPDFYITVAQRIEKETPNSLYLYQYGNPANPDAHYKTTGPEIWEQTEGKITHFVAGIGTGGTISGTAKYLKEKNPNIQVIGADPYGSIFKEYKENGKLIDAKPYLVEGIGQDCLPDNVSFQYIDRIINISDTDSFKYAKKLTKEEGIFCGGSTGTIVAGMLQVAKDLDENAVVVFIVCDTGERYLTKFHNNEWLRDKRMVENKAKTLKDIVEAKRKSNNSELVSVEPSDNVKTAISLLNIKGFSQLPVIDNGVSVGCIKESDIMVKLLNEPNLINQPVSKIMENALPSIDDKTELSSVKKYLSESPAILVKEYGRIIDIVTRYDIIEHSDI